MAAAVPKDGDADGDGGSSALINGADATVAGPGGVLEWTIHHGPPEYDGPAPERYPFSNVRQDSCDDGDSYTGPDRQGTPYAQGGDPTFYFVIDLGSPKHVTTLILRPMTSEYYIGNGHYRLVDFEVAVSNDPEVFGEFRRGTVEKVNGRGAQGLEKIPINAHGRYGRVHFGSEGGAFNRTEHFDFKWWIVDSGAAWAWVC